MTAGLIRGGIKVNIVPRRCEVEIDCRVPFGVTPRGHPERHGAAPGAAGIEGVQFESMLARVQRELHVARAPAGGASRAPTRRRPRVSEPQLTVTFAATDARYFRPRGVPTLIFGPRPNNMAAPDEFITVDDLVAVTKVHLATAIDFLQDQDAR